MFGVTTVQFCVSAGVMLLFAKRSVRGRSQEIEQWREGCQVLETTCAHCRYERHKQCSASAVRVQHLASIHSLLLPPPWSLSMESLTRMHSKASAPSTVHFTLCQEYLAARMAPLALAMSSCTYRAAWHATRPSAVCHITSAQPFHEHIAGCCLNPQQALG